MSHFAQIENGIVIQVIVVEQDVLDTGLFGDPASWIQTSYNTQGGAHILGGTPLRKNYAGIGSIYDPIKDAFYSPQPYESWILDEDTCIWQPPVARPETVDGKWWMWDESIVNWKEVVIPSPAGIEV